MFTEDVLEKEQEDQEQRIQQTLFRIKQKYGNNAVFKGMNLQEAQQRMERNNQIGGHKA